MAALLAFATPATAFDFVFAFGDNQGSGVVLPNDGDSLDNAARISDDDDPGNIVAIVDAGSASFILNRATGEIENTNSAGSTYAIRANSVGDLTNHGTIWATNQAILVNNNTGTFLNTGNIGSNYTTVNLSSVQSITNTGTIYSHQASMETGLYAQTVGDFSNSGGIFGYGTSVRLVSVDSFVNTGDIGYNWDGDAGSLLGAGINSAGSFFNSGRIFGDETAVDIGEVETFLNTGDLTSDDVALNISYLAGTVTNTGRMYGGGDAGAFLYSVGTFVNSGDIFGDSAGVTADTIVNFVNTGRIGNDWTDPGYYSFTGVSVGGMTTFFNSGEIYGYESAVGIYQVEDFVNAGELISDYGMGAFVYEAKTITNTGDILGGIAGVATSRVGTFFNSGTITGEEIAVALGRAKQVHNTGTISGLYGGLTVGIDYLSSDVSRRSASIFNYAGGLIEATDSSGCGCFPSVGLGFVNGTLNNMGTIRGGVGVVIDGSVRGHADITNSGTIEGTARLFDWPFGSYPPITMAILFDNDDPELDPDDNFYDADWNNHGRWRKDTLRLLPGSRILGAIDFARGNDTLDLTNYQGSMFQLVYNLEKVVPGKSLLIDAHDVDPYPFVATIDDTSLKSAGVAQFGDYSGMLLQSISGALNGEAGGTGGPTTLNYFPQGPQSGAASAAGNLATTDENGRKVWGAAFGGLSGDGTVGNAYSHFLGGLVAGSHVAVGSNTIAGGVVSLGAGQFTTPAQGHVITSTVGALGLYGETDLDVATLDFALLAGGSVNHSVREVSGVFGVQSAVADYMSWFVSPAVALSVPVALFDAVDTEAGLSLQYVGGSVGAYDETGSVLNISMPAQVVSLLEARAEFRASSTVGSNDHGDVTVTGTVGALAQANLGAADLTFGVTSAFGAGGTLVSTAPGTMVYGGYAGAELNAPLGNSLDLTFIAGGQIRSDEVAAVSGSAKLAGSF